MNNRGRWDQTKRRRSTGQSPLGRETEGAEWKLNIIGKGKMRGGRTGRRAGGVVGKGWMETRLSASQPAFSLDLCKPDMSPWSSSVPFPYTLERKQPWALQVKIGVWTGGLASFPALDVSWRGVCVQRTGRTPLASGSLPHPKPAELKELLVRIAHGALAGQSRWSRGCRNGSWRTMGHF